MRQRKVQTLMQNVAREQKREQRKIEKIEKKMNRQTSEEGVNERNARRRAALRAAQMENLKTLEGLRKELKPQDFRRGTGTRGATDEGIGSGGGGKFKSLATNLIAVKKVEGDHVGPGALRNSITMGEFSRRNLNNEDDRSVLSSVGSKKEEEQEEEPQIFTATWAAMKLAASATHYPANGQSRFNAALGAMKLSDLSSQPDWHKTVDDEAENNEIDESIEEYDSRPIPLKMRGSSGLDLINIEDLKPTSRDAAAVGRGKSNSSWEDEPENKMNYNEDESSYESSYEDSNERECLNFHPTPLPLNPLREDSEASVEAMLPSSGEHLKSSEEQNNFPRGDLLKNQGKTSSGKTNRTISTNTMHSSNDSVGGASDISSLRGRKSKISQLRKNLRNSFSKLGSGGSVTSAVSELTPGSRRPDSSQSVGTSASSKWRRRLSGLTGGGSLRNSKDIPPQYVEAKETSGGRRQALKSEQYIASSVVSDLTNISSSRTVGRKPSLVDEGSVSRSVSSRFGEFFDDSSHAQALSDALSVHSHGTLQNSITSYYRFPTHEHPLIRIRPIELFPKSPGWQCDSCSMETTNTRTMAYVSTDRNFIVCRQCFASLGSKIEYS